MVSREMRFVLVKLRGDGRGDCFVAAPFFFFFFFLFLLYCPYQSSLRWSLKEEICLFSLPLFQRRLLLLGNLEGIWHLGELDFITVFWQYFLNRLNLYELKHKSKKNFFLLEAVNTGHLSSLRAVWLIMIRINRCAVTDLFLDQLPEKRIRSFQFSFLNNKKLKKKKRLEPALHKQHFDASSTSKHPNSSVSAVMQRQLRKKI